MGCGGHGSAITYHLARRGIRVLTLERYGLNHTNGSSHGKTRIIRTAYAEGEIYVPLVRRSKELWVELENESGTRLMQMTGGLYVGNSESSLVSGTIESARAHLLPYRLLDATENKKMYPVFRPSQKDVGVFEEDAGILFPERCIKAHADMAEREGAEMHFGESVVSWKSSEATKDARTIVSTNREAYSAERLIFASGSWLPELVPNLGISFAIERQVVFWFKPREHADLFGAERMPIFIWEDQALQTEYAKTFYGIGDTGDGFKVAQSHGGEVIDRPEHVRREITDGDASPVSRFVEEKIQFPAGPYVSSTTCVYTNTPDGKFLIDHHPKFNNVIIASPCSGHGFKFSSAIGELVSEMVIEGEVKKYDISNFGVNRFGRVK